MLSAVVCVGKKSSLWNFDFYYECYVCNASIERNLNHFVPFNYLCKICVVFSVHDGEVLCLGVHDLQQRQSSGSFQVSQGCRAACSLCYLTQFLITAIITYTYSHVVRTSKYF